MQAINSINNITVDLSLPVLKQPMLRDEFVAQLKAAQQAMFPEQPLPRLRQIKFNDFSASIKFFEDFINAKELSSINPTEALLDDFLEYIINLKGSDKHQYCQELCNKIRNLVNTFPSNILNRPLVNSKRKKYLTRFDHFSKITKDFLNDFVKDGRMLNKKRHLGGAILSSKLLSPRFRAYIVWVAYNFLNVIGKTCLLEVTPKDAEVLIQFYEAQGRRDLALRYLADLQRVFLNLIGKGLWDKNPIEQYNERPPIKINDDFVMPEVMEKVQDLSTVDFNDFFDVRDRMLTFVWSYDFCLRDGETSLVDVPDIVRDGSFIGITLRSEIQKGQNKPTVTLYNCFPESRRLILAYLELRMKYLGGSCNDALIIGYRKERLGGQGICGAIQRHCKKLGVTTRKGDCPTPHEFRHTFATINIDRIGLRLTPYFIQGRLRHGDLETTIKIYVNNNPLLAKLNHIANVQEGRERINNLQSNGSAAGMVATVDSKPNDFSMSETEAVKALRSYGISTKALRDYAESKEIIEKKNKNYYYSRSHISDLSRNWFTKQQVMNRLKFGISRFYVWKKSRGIKPVVIGKISLVQASDVIEELKK